MLIGAIKKTCCSKCDKIQEKYVNIEDFYNNKLKCHCGGTLGPVSHSKNKSTRWGNILVDTTLGYYDNQLGEYIESTSHRRKICKEKGWTMIKSGESDQIKPRKEMSDQEKTEQYKTMFKKTAFEHGMAISG